MPITSNGRRASRPDGRSLLAEVRSDLLFPPWYTGLLGDATADSVHSLITHRSDVRVTDTRISGLAFPKVASRA
jgi:hypothetical protein